MPDLLAARSQMALSLGWHIVLACFGVGFPLIVLLAEWRFLREAAQRCRARGSGAWKGHFPCPTRVLNPFPAKLFARFGAERGASKTVVP